MVAYVEWTALRPGYKGGIESREAWFRQDNVESIDGRDYSRVPRTYARPERP